MLPINNKATTSAKGRITPHMMLRLVIQSIMISDISNAGPAASTLEIYLDADRGNNPRAIFEPSKGKRGSRLNKASIILKNIIKPTKSWNRFDKLEIDIPLNKKGECQSINPNLIGTPRVNANSKFDIGPAPATIVLSLIHI